MSKVSGSRVGGCGSVVLATASMERFIRRMLLKQFHVTRRSFDPCHHSNLLIPSKIITKYGFYLSGFRYYAAQHNPAGNIWSIKRFIKNEEKRIAADVFEHHLHERKGLSVVDAGVISRNAPAFLKKLIILSKRSKLLGLKQYDNQEGYEDDVVRLRIEKALAAHRLNEWESVIESIGIPPEKASQYLHLLKPRLAGNHIFLNNIKILEEFYIPRRKLGNIFYSQNGMLMKFSPAQLSANIGKFESLGIKKDQLGPMLQKYPEMLKLNAAEVLRPALQVLEELRVNRKVLGRLLVHNPQVILEDPTVLMQKVKFLAKCGMTMDYIASVLKKNPEIILSNLMDQNLMLFSHGYSSHQKIISKIGSKT